MINSFKNPAIMRILRTTERYEAGWREQNFIPDNGIVEEVNIDTNTGAILKMKYTWNGTKYVEMTGGIWGDVKKIGE